jgi:hypothetical protein
MSTLQPNITRANDRRPNPVRVTLFVGKISEAETVAMVAYEDGTYDILRNDSSTAASTPTSASCGPADLLSERFHLNARVRAPVERLPSTSIPLPLPSCST